MSEAGLWLSRKQRRKRFISRVFVGKPLRNEPSLLMALWFND